MEAEADLQESDEDDQKLHLFVEARAAPYRRRVPRISNASLYRNAKVGFL